MAKEVIFKHNSILLDPLADKQLATQGYTTFPFLGEIEIEKLKKYYNEFQKENLTYFYASTHSPDFTFRRKTSEFIKESISAKVPKLLKNYELLGGAFVVKPGNGKGILQPHQDWNLVDEEKARSYNLWIPLIDVNTENGAIHVLPESHKKKMSWRGPHIPSDLKNTEELLWQKMQPLNMKAGEGLLYDHALIHGSPPNKTSNIRIGIVVGVAPKETPLQLCFGENNLINAYTITPDFFLTQNPMIGPKGLEFIRCFGEIPQGLSTREVQTTYLSNGKYWFSKIIKWK